MKQGFSHENWSDEDGNPAGGVVSGCGFTISWQNGPLGRGDDRKAPNGAFVEDVIDAVIKRIEFYQDNKFDCDENDKALVHLEWAAKALDRRTKDRETRSVEGTHKI